MVLVVVGLLILSTAIVMTVPEGITAFVMFVTRIV